MKTLPFYILMVALCFMNCSLIAGGPVANDDNFTLFLSSDVIIINPLLNDDLNGNDSIEVRVINQPDFGEVMVDEKTNNLVFQVSGNEGGEISLTYELCGFSADCGFTCSTASIEVEVLKVPKIPNGLTLNGDGFNDGMILSNVRSFDRMEVTILNRWGALLYQNDNYKNSDPWRGEIGNSGEVVEPGVYYFHIRAFKDNKKVGDPQSGALYIFQ